MALKTLVKISEVNNLSDARYCAGMRVAFLGFSLDKTNSRFISPSKFKEITKWVSGVAFVGEVAPPDLPKVDQLLASYTLDYLQLPYPCLLYTSPSPRDA